jgi:hypothetical protein
VSMPESGSTGSLERGAADNDYLRAAVSVQLLVEILRGAAQDAGCVPGAVACTRMAEVRVAYGTPHPLQNRLPGGLN